MKYGIFGGTFNPPHIGHMILAETAADALHLDQVFFTPAADPPHKVGIPRADVEDRIHMLELSMGDNPRFNISRIDVDRPGPHYSVDMVKIFKEQHPQAEVYFLIGSDSLRDLLKWRTPDKLIEQCYLAVMNRPAVVPDMDTLQQQLPMLSKKLINIPAPEIDIASSDLVMRISNGQSIRYRVADAVLEYINEKNLYRK